jgi:hypothetical protein
VNHSLAIDLRESYVVLADIAFKGVYNVLDGTPLGDVGTLESHVFLLGVQHAPLLDNELLLVHIATLTSRLVTMQSVRIVLQIYYRVVTQSSIRRAGVLVHQGRVLLFDHKFIVGGVSWTTLCLLLARLVTVVELRLL